MGRLSRFLRKAKNLAKKSIVKRKSDVDSDNLKMNRLKRVLQSSSTYSMVSKEYDNVCTLITGSKSTNNLEMEAKEPLLSEVEEIGCDDDDEDVEQNVVEDEEEIENEEDVVEDEEEEEVEILQVELQNVELFDSGSGDDIDDSTVPSTSDLTHTTNYVSLSPLICLQSAPSHEVQYVKEQDDISDQTIKKKKALKEKLGCFSNFFQLVSSCTRKSS